MVGVRAVGWCWAYFFTITICTVCNPTSAFFLTIFFCNQHKCISLCSVISFCTGAKIRPTSSLKIRSKNNNSTKVQNLESLPTNLCIYIIPRYIKKYLDYFLIRWTIIDNATTDGSAIMANRVLPRIVGNRLCI